MRPTSPNHPRRYGPHDGAPAVVAERQKRLGTADSLRGDCEDRQAGSTPMRRAYGCPWSQSLYSKAAEGGNVVVMEWARTYECPLGVDSGHVAARARHLMALQWAHSTAVPGERKLVGGLRPGGICRCYSG